MSAKEMFEELGYEVREETSSIDTIKCYFNRDVPHHIYFDNDRTIDVGDIIISLDLLQAINKQVEELGWK